MNYISLTKIYYQNNKIYENEYSKYFNNFTAKHLDIYIKEYNHKTSYPAFFNYTEEIILLIEHIYKSYENLLYIIHSVPKIVLHQFALLSILEEVKSTNAIEGVHSSRQELRKILDGNASQNARFYSIVHKYNNLLGNSEIEFSTNQNLRDFYEDFAHKELIREDERNTLDGNIFRKDPVDVKSPTEKIIHRGLSPESKILETMQKSLNILHDDSIPFLIRLSLFHYLFAYIHPFYDGNGRTDRFITSYFLSKHFHKIAALRLSAIIRKNQKKYYDLFAEANSEINRADLTPFITGFLEFLLKTFDDTIETLKRKKEKLSVYKEKISQLNVNDELTKDIYYILLQAALFYGQGISISDLMSITEKSRGTIQNRIDNIPSDHLIKTKNHKTIYYKLNLMIFSKALSV